MSTLSLVELARILAEHAHFGQTRRGGAPYITHPAAVVNSLAPDDYDGRVVAWLHDVLEDTQVTVDQLVKTGIPAHLAGAVQTLTKVDGEDYFTYLLKVKADPIARRVKVADMRHNLSEQPTEKAKARYTAGLKVLGS